VQCAAHYVAVRCSVLQCAYVRIFIVYVYMQERCNMESRLNFVDTPGVCCSVLHSGMQCIVVYCSMLQYVAVCECKSVDCICIHAGTVYH